MLRDEQSKRSAKRMTDDCQAMDVYIFSFFLEMPVRRICRADHLLAVVAFARGSVLPGPFLLGLCSSNRHCSHPGLWKGQYPGERGPETHSYFLQKAVPIPMSVSPRRFSGRSFHNFHDKRLLLEKLLFLQDAITALSMINYLTIL